MLSSTLNQGKSAASWNKTLRRGSGRITGSPRNSTAPRVGPWNPATMLRSVDLPQPGGPRTAANSLGAILRSMPSRATSRPDRPLNSLKTPRSSATGAVAGRGADSGMPLQRPPAQHHLGGSEDDLVGDEAEQSHGEHRGDTDVHPSDVVRVPQDVPEAGLDRDHLGDDDGRPRHSDAEAQAGEDGGQGRGQDDLQENGPLARPQHARGAKEQQIRVPHAVGGVDHDRVEGAEPDQEEGAGVV